MDLLAGRRSMQTLRKLPTARPSRAKTRMPAISTGVYCAGVEGLKSIPARH